MRFTGVLNFGQKRIVSTLNRQGDLLAGLTLEIDLPIMEGKNSSNTNDLYWIKSIGHYIIDTVELEIGGQIIDTQYGEWMEIWNELQPDIVTGWNVETFDIAYLVNRIWKLFGWDAVLNLSPHNLVTSREWLYMGQKKITSLILE